MVVRLVSCSAWAVVAVAVVFEVRIVLFLPGRLGMAVVVIAVMFVVRFVRRFLFSFLTREQKS